MIAGVARGGTVVVDDGDLAEVEMGPTGNRPGEGVVGIVALGEQIEDARAESRVGDVLGGDRAHLGAGMGAAPPPTQIDEVVMATPNMPVLAQCPAMEKVMPKAPSASDGCSP
jgi:hypothetical protein